MPQKHIEIKVCGLVHGVGFRAAAIFNARELRLTGYAQNQQDGSVLIVAEGEESKLKEFVKRCRTGPGKVEKVDVEWEEAKGEFEGFDAK